MYLISNKNNEIILINIEDYLMNIETIKKR